MIELMESATVFKLCLKRGGVVSYQRGMNGVEEIVPMTHPILGPVFVIHQGVTSDRQIFDLIPAAQVVSVRMVREVIE
jgi:hypothetical protein